MHRALILIFCGMLTGSLLLGVPSRAGSETGGASAAGSPAVAPDRVVAPPAAARPDPASTSASGSPAAHAVAPAASAAASSPREGDDWLLEGWKRVQQARTAAEAQTALRHLEAEGLSRGVQSLPAPALALIRGDDLRLPLSDRLAWAKRLARLSAAVQFAAARAALLRAPAAVPALYLDALRALGQDFGYLAGLASRLVLVVTLGLAFAFLAFGSALLFLHGGGILHDLGHQLPVTLPRGLAAAAAVAVVGVPLILGLGWIWLSAFWVVGVWGSLAWRRRRVALAFLALLAASQPIARVAASLIPSPDSQSVMAAILHAETGTMTASERALLERETARGTDPIAIFARAEASRQAGQLAAAESALRQALALRPGWVAARNNLAILRIEQNRLAEAENLLRGALDREPRDARVHYNLSYLYRRQFRLQEADAEYRRARDLDADAVDRFTQMADPLAMDRNGSFAIPAGLGQADLWRWRLAKNAQTGLLAERIAAPLTGRVPLVWVAPLVAALLLGGIAASRWPGHRGRAGRCMHCGIEVCPACFGTQLRDGVCLPCHTIYLRGERVEVMAKLAQDQRVRRHRIEIRRQVLFAGAILPGLGHLMLGATLHGTALLVLACVSIYAPLALGLSGALGGLWTPLQAAPLGGLLLAAATTATVAVVVLGPRDLMKRLRPI